MAPRGKKKASSAAETTARTKKPKSAIREEMRDTTNKPNLSNNGGVKTTTTQIEPALVLFDDSSSFLWVKGEDDARSTIAKVKWRDGEVKYFASNIEELQMVKNFNDKHLPASVAPTKAELAWAMVTGVKPCIMKFKDNSAAMHVLGKKFAEDRLLLMQNDWVGEVTVQEEPNADLAKTVCDMYNQFCTTDAPLSGKVLSEIFGVKK
jgi:hypothetical protein